MTEPERQGEQPIRVLLVDDHAIIREGLRDLIATRHEMTVVGDAATRDAALELARSVRPDVVVLDLDLGADSGLRMIPELLEAAGPSTSIIVLTGVREVEKRDEAMALGARGVVLKEKGATELLSAIEKVHRTGELWLEPGAARRLLERRRAPAEDPEAAKIATLTPTCCDPTAEDSLLALRKMIGFFERQECG